MVQLSQLESLKRLIQQGNIAIPDDLKEDFLQTTASGSGSLNDSKRGGDSDFETGKFINNAVEFHFMFSFR